MLTARGLPRRAASMRPRVPAPGWLRSCCRFYLRWSCEHSFPLLMQGSGLRERFAVGHLKMWLVYDGSPVAAPLEPQFFANLPDDAICLGLRHIFSVLEYPDVESYPVVVPRRSWFCVGDDLPRFRTSLVVEGLLLRVAACAADELDLNALLGCLSHELPCGLMERQEKGGDDLLAAGINTGASGEWDRVFRENLVERRLRL